MKAMILAAGLGSRLKPITDSKPKALVEVGGITLLERIILRLKSFGFNELIINIHHFGEQVIEFLNEKQNFNLKIEISDERGLLLETGGGIKSVSWFLENEPFIVHNVDIISNIDLQKLFKFHIENKAIATLAVQNRNSSRYFFADENNLLCGWENTKTGEIRKLPCLKNNYKRFAFSGIHVISPEIFPLITENGKFSIIDVYLRIANNCPIKLFDHSEDFLLDVGKMDQLSEINEVLKNNEI